MMFTIEFFRIRKEDNARAMLDRITHIATDLESAKVKQVALRNFEYASEPRWLADFGPEWARGVLLDAEDGGFLETRMVRIATQLTHLRLRIRFLPKDIGTLSRNVALLALQP